MTIKVFISAWETVIPWIFLCTGSYFISNAKEREIRGPFFSFPETCCQCLKESRCLYDPLKSPRRPDVKAVGCNICHPGLSRLLCLFGGRRGPCSFSTVPCSWKEAIRSFSEVCESYRSFALTPYYCFKMILWMPAHGILMASLMAVSACKWKMCPHVIWKVIGW